MAQQVNTVLGNAFWGGVLFSFLGNLGWEEIIRTVVLAIIGTLVSFLASAFLKRLADRRKK